MNELTIPGAATPEVASAVQLHSDIMANMRAAASAMVEFCRGLKRMRDEKHYIALGFESFEDYTERHN